MKCCEVTNKLAIYGTNAAKMGGKGQFNLMILSLLRYCNKGLC